MVKRTISGRITVPGTIILFLLIVATFANCSRQGWLIKKMPDTYADIFRKIKFIITKKERKEFLNLTTDTDRDKFIKKFWEKRDPDPETAENEFKEEYFSRITKAEHLFSHEGKIGWETDRGRVYILLGPPDFKQSYPMGYSMYDNPSEVWYYGNFPVPFIDRNRSGSLDLTSLGARHFAQLLKSSQLLKPEISDKKGFYNFTSRVEKISSNDIRLILLLKNKNIYFKSDQNFFYSDVEITLNFNLLGSHDSWSIKRERRILINKNKATKPEKTSELIIPLNLRSGIYEFNITIENSENNIKTYRKIKIKI